MEIITVVKKATLVWDNSCAAGLQPLVELPSDTHTHPPASLTSMT